MYLQFHLTSKCNLRCNHCYQESYEDDSVSFESYKFFIDSFVDYAKRVKQEEHVLIALTGGEPFLIKDFFKYLKYASDKADYVDILTNGTLISHSVAARLSKIPNLDHVQMSLEGPKPINDQIRGKGVYDKVIHSINLLTEYDIRTSISCSIAPYNFNKLKELYADLSKTTLSYIWFDRCVPNNRTDFLTKEQFYEFLSQLNEIRNMYFHCKTLPRVSTQKALQFQQKDYDESNIYDCAAYNHVCFMPNGDVLNCRRNGIVIGNIYKNTLDEIYSSKIVKNQKEQMLAIPKDCSKCKYSISCRGGSKCITYKYYGDYNHKDINCKLEDI